MSRFAIQDDQFLLDGQPFQIRSGEIHYNRVPRAYWRDRMVKAKAMGLNTICTYVFWNEHERERGQWDFSGNLDLAAYVNLAQELGLLLILRPGPYVCSEWEWGGLPYWLANVPGIQVRQNNPEFLKLSRQYLLKVGEQVSGKTIEKGGPIILVQVENEYGSFGSDHEYMAAIRDQLVEAGFEGELFTSDGPTPEMLEGGTLPGVTAVINFGSKPEERFTEFARFRMNVPRMCGELWFGWFDHWGCEHHLTPTESQAEDLDWFMREGVSFNLYMFHGGTNWGFMNGANWTADGFRPDVSSYDYDAALAEDGRLTDKWHAFRAVIERHLTESLHNIPDESVPESLPEVAMTSSCPMISLTGVGADGWRSFEELGHGYGYVLYQVKLPTPGIGVLTLNGLQDYAVIMSGGRVLGTLDRRLGECDLSITHDGTIEVLVENTGRINYAKQMLTERKGIRGAFFNDVPLTDVRAFPIEFSRAQFLEGIEQSGPALYRGEFHLEELNDTHLDLRGWGKGNVWVNGFNLGRNWEIGPQQTTYCPATLLKAGLNEIIVSDLIAGRKRSVVGLSDPILG